MIRRITIAVLAAALAGAVLAVPALSKGGSAVVAKKKAKKKCKKKKKAKKGKKAKKCKKAGGSTSVSGLPGEATPSSPTPPNGPGTPAALHVKSVGVSPDTVFAGNPTTGQVTVDVAAPSGGQQVDLKVTGAPSVSVPGSAVIPAGQKTAAFTVATTPGVAATATVTASIGTSNATAQLNVVDKPSVKSVQLERQCFTPKTWSDNRVILDVPAPADTVVSLSSSLPESLAPTTSAVTVLAGSTSAAFGVEAFAVPTIGVGATIFAAAPSTPPQSDSASVSLTDPTTHAAALTLDPATVGPGAGSFGTVTLDCEAPPGGTAVTLGSQDESIVGFPETTVTVPAGELSVGFAITTATGIVDGVYDISAEAGGETVHASLTITSVHTT